MRILFIGDIVGRTGRDALAAHLPGLKNELAPDIIIANAENAAHGFGLTPKICAELYELGIGALTSGNHVWDQREIIPYIDRDPRLLRAINFPKGTPGRGATILDLPDGRRIMVIHVMGRLFMDALDDPFAATEEVLTTTRLGPGGVNAIFVDVHAEATAEKACFAHLFDGRVSAVIGTHTHVPTADHRILKGGTAFQSDAGMTGDYDSSIGMRKDIAIQKVVRKMPTEKLSPADGEATLCATLVETDDTTGRAKSIRPLRRGGELESA